MTTSVRVINFGPRPVQLTVGNDTSDKTSAVHMNVVYPGQISSDICLHDTQSVLVEEIKE